MTSARCLPEHPTFTTESERLVWERLARTLPVGSTLLANLRITDETKDHEADLIALVPDVGIVVVEVKGGQVTYDGEWHLQAGAHGRRIHPIDQARSTTYAVRDYVEADPRWQRRRVSWSYAFVAPWSRFPADFSTPECPRWMLHDRDDVEDLAFRLDQTVRESRRDTRPPTADDIALICEILRGRGFTTPDRNLAAEERRHEADRLTAEQGALLQVTRLLHRVEVRGGAGSGKTVLALAQARQLASGRDGRPPQRVALLCYSVGLARYLRRETDSWPRHQRPAYVGTYEGLGRRWGAPSGDRDNSRFWEVDLPARMADLAADLPDAERFDAIIVDEAQDFADAWWVPLLRAMRDEELSGLYVYSDENQRIFSRFGQPPVPLVPLVLDHNLRNTRQIHEAFGPLAPTRMTARGGDGVDVTFLPVEAGADVLDVGDAAVDVLLDAGWFPSNIALLTTGSRHPIQTLLVERDGHDAYWDVYFDDDEVFYGHVLGCKGLERPAVVLCVNESKARDRSREKLYVGMSRATDHLIVVGDPAIVREIAGPTVAARLGVR